ncbi:hypothetical protein CNR22_14545 [Sphingobacteriaceae bacterium]|nr:hypothetical protein CNR22_14545 [Sphingobacteriaceae bacterium]
MRINLIKRQTVKDFVLRNSGSKKAFEDWLFKIKAADWEVPGDMKTTFNSVDFLGKNCHRVVFDIGGNNYRLICKYAFGDNEVHLFICWIGTHAHYDELCSENRQYTVSLY